MKNGWRACVYASRFSLVVFLRIWRKVLMGKNKNGFVKKKISLKVVLIVIVALFALTIVNGSFYSVKEQEQAILTMFGKVVRVDTAGLYFKIPYIQQVHLVDMTTHGIGIGYVLKDGQNITVDDEGNKATGRATDEDIVKASIDAILSSTNKLLMLKD
jgi:membrane protease subunit HflK